MAEVYIHIGAPKTATSTLQSVLAQKSAKLLKQGVLYPAQCRSGDAHHVLVCDLIEEHHGSSMPDVWYGDYPRGQSWQALGDEIAGYGDKVQRVVISSELFFGQTRNLDEILEDIRARLAGHQVHIVAYLRRQDQLYSSFFNQDVKGARQWPGTAYQFYATHQIFQRDYYSIMQAYADAFGADNVHLRPFEPGQWHHGDIVSDFCASTGLPGLSAGSIERNESLGPNQLYIKQALNRLGFEKAHNEDILRIVLKLCPERSARNIMYVNKRPYMRLREEWLKTNRKLSRSYLQGEPFFREAIPSATQLEPFETDAVVLQDYLKRLVARLQRGSYAEYRTLLAQAALLLAAEQNLWGHLPAEQIQVLLEFARE
ncbi:MAG: hypothetical protein AAGI11_16180 [Pseudomonadota bacterium]